MSFHSAEKFVILNMRGHKADDDGAAMRCDAPEEREGCALLQRVKVVMQGNRRVRHANRVRKPLPMRSESLSQRRKRW